MALDLSKIIKLDFPESQYIREECKKTQIVLHHTGSGKGVNGDYQTWLSNPVRIATCVIIDSDGKINQCFSSKYWGYHLGLDENTFKKLGLKYQSFDKTSIGVEIDAWGALQERNGVYYAYPNNFGTTGKATIVPKENVICYSEGFKGFKYYERYTEAQIKAVKELLIHWNETYGIPLEYNEDMWNLSKNAMSGKAGIWAHVSFREGNQKSDAHPQPELVNMLKNISVSKNNL